MNKNALAFPRLSDLYSQEFNGMTLRDYFAANAMQGMLAAAENYRNDDLARFAYAVADEMMAARDK